MEHLSSWARSSLSYILLLGWLTTIIYLVSISSWWEVWLYTSIGAIIGCGIGELYRWYARRKLIKEYADKISVTPKEFEELLKQSKQNGENSK